MSGEGVSVVGVAGECVCGGCGWWVWLVSVSVEGVVGEW